MTVYLFVDGQVRGPFDIKARRKKHGSNNEYEYQLVENMVHGEAWIAEENLSASRYRRTWIRADGTLIVLGQSTMKSFMILALMCEIVSSCIFNAK